MAEHQDTIQMPPLHRTPPKYYKKAWHAVIGKMIASVPQHAAQLEEGVLCLIFSLPKAFKRLIRCILPLSLMLAAAYQMVMEVVRMD
ncbi:hypothetical protein CRENBAI_009323 [Crenichthys baileyi]|uniref:Uncharacterized protein n=1 Tax=Crenichthys baileyi TaxID=28760 RepID=A0AAV9S1W3_9TELE